MNKKYLVSGGILILLLVFGVGWALAQGENMNYYACVNNSSGTIKMISEGESCQSNEILIQWNQVGPQGPQGEPGNLALAGQSCPPFQYIKGFNQNGDIVCADPRPGFTPVAQNADWTPMTQEIKGALMALVPAGCLGERCFDTPFWIDVYEVTNAQYGSSGRWADDNLPRENINWYDAKAFCEARGARLPDEYEWEYAARGPDLLVYPWGNDFDPANVVSVGNNCDDFTGGPATCVVGSRPGGVSWVGAQDMSGNVVEWMINDFDSSSDKVVRGGQWFWDDFGLRSAERESNPPEHYDLAINGFRCARTY